MIDLLPCYTLKLDKSFLSSATDYACNFRKKFCTYQMTYCTKKYCRYC